MNQVLPKGWSIESFSIDGLSPEALVIAATVAGLIAVAAVIGLMIVLLRSREKPPVEDPAMVGVQTAPPPG
jgi:hypothetical protein